MLLILKKEIKNTQADLALICIYYATFKAAQLSVQKQNCSLSATCSLS